jgi:hypothetical protein
MGRVPFRVDCEPVVGLRVAFPVERPQHLGPARHAGRAPGIAERGRIEIVQGEVTEIEYLARVLASRFDVDAPVRAPGPPLIWGRKGIRAVGFAASASLAERPS